MDVLPRRRADETPRSPEVEIRIHKTPAPVPAIDRHASARKAYLVPAHTPPRADGDPIRARRETTIFRLDEQRYLPRHGVRTEKIGITGDPLASASLNGPVGSISVPPRTGHRHALLPRWCAVTLHGDDVIVFAALHAVDIQMPGPSSTGDSITPSTLPQPHTRFFKSVESVTFEHDMDFRFEFRQRRQADFE